MTTYSNTFQPIFHFKNHSDCILIKHPRNKKYFAVFTLYTFFLHTIQGIEIKKMRKWFSVLFLVLSIWCLTCSWEKRLICHDIALADFSSASKFVMCCKVILWAARGIHKLQSIFFWTKFQKKISKWMIKQMDSVIWQFFLLN